MDTRPLPTGCPTEVDQWHTFAYEDEKKKKEEERTGGCLLHGGEEQFTQSVYRLNFAYSFHAFFEAGVSVSVKDRSSVPFQDCSFCLPRRVVTG